MKNKLRKIGPKIPRKAHKTSLAKLLKALERVLLLKVLLNSSTRSTRQKKFISKMKKRAKVNKTRMKLKLS